MSGEGYERDESRMSEESISSNGQNIGKNKRNAELCVTPIARKRRGTQNQGSHRINHLIDSGYEQDLSSDMAVIGNVKGKLDREEETQVLPISLGSYVDHSLDPDDGRPFAPIHRKPNFPESLFAILSNFDLSSIIKWLPHGRSFVILNQHEFAERVLPVYFRHSNLSSFNRQLNGYGFNKIKIGPHEKSYYHPLFLRNLPHLVKNIKRCNRAASQVEQIISSESQLEMISAERPLPKKLSRTYANHIKEMNQIVYEGFGLQEHRGQPQAHVASDVPAFVTQHESSLHHVPSVIYTPSPQPYTPPPQYQPQSLPSFGNTRRPQTLGIPTFSTYQQGTVYAESHQPLMGVAPNPTLQNALIPIQTQPFLPYHQPVNIQASSSTVPQTIVGTGQHVAAQANTVPQSAFAQGQAQLNQEQAVAYVNEVRRQAAQLQLLKNALAAAVGHQGQNFQPISLLGAPQLVMSPSVNTSLTAQSSPTSQMNDLQQQTANSTANLAPGSNLQLIGLLQEKHCNYSSTSGYGPDVLNQQGQSSVQPFSILGASQLVASPTLITSPTMQPIENSKWNCSPQQTTQSNLNSQVMNGLQQQQFGSIAPNDGNNACSNNTDGQQTRET
eukprot:CAMPEP_0172322542 /NCGR_PEP_ID=MMETSP1058-20130122/46192_1 /TAXON_ID=83371 /ORGANISM="Detonula confervacea, Strain CCMP 353" /LENGTH=612 /DNA_ID=CAMNT_0013038309 /DNA_START=447 /DNA_END=2285 /DNA_ORIENTATION=+